MDDQSGPADPFRSVLRLFLSADIVGSTAYKQNVGADGAAQAGGVISLWYQPIAVFFREMERQFAREWKRYVEIEAPKCGWPKGPPPELWKGVGDEVIYTKELVDSRESMCTVQCWMRAVAACREILRQRHSPLDIKASAWIAGFPVRNAEIIFPSVLSFDEHSARDGDALEISVSRISEYYNGPSRGHTRDFVGPSIDTGFRIASLATSRKMTLSIDLAWMLAVARLAQPNRMDMGVPRFHYDGMQQLKGLAEPYPLFWIDMDDKRSPDDLEHGLTKDVSLEEIMRFSEQFISKSAFHTAPYITDQRETSFRDIPLEHADWIAKIKRYSADERAKADQAARNMEEPLTGEGMSVAELEKTVSDFFRSTASHYRKSLGIEDQSG